MFQRINRLERRKDYLKGGFGFLLYLKIYGTNNELNVMENASAIDLYNMTGACMNIGSESLSIEICRMGTYVEGMGHIFTSKDLIWNREYNFYWYKVKIVKRNKTY
jgi:hypothetical protein